MPPSPDLASGSPTAARWAGQELSILSPPILSCASSGLPRPGSAGLRPATQRAPGGKGSLTRPLGRNPPRPSPELPAGAGAMAEGGGAQSDEQGLSTGSGACGGQGAACRAVRQRRAPGGERDAESPGVSFSAELCEGHGPTVAGGDLPSPPMPSYGGPCVPPSPADFQLPAWIPPTIISASDGMGVLWQFWFKSRVCVCVTWQLTEGPASRRVVGGRASGVLAHLGHLLSFLPLCPVTDSG